MSEKSEKNERSRFFQSLAFKLSVAIFMIASILLSSLGTYYIRKFSTEIDRRLQDKARLPGRLMNDGVILPSAARDQALLSSLTGEEVLMAAITGPDQQILYSLDANEEGQSAEIYRPYANMRLAETGEDGAVVVRGRESQHGFLYASVPLIGGEREGGFFHLKVSTLRSDAVKRQIAHGFLFGFILSIFLITAVCAILIHGLTVPRLRGIMNVLMEVEEGNLSPSVPPAESQDEFGVLGRSVAHMVNELAQRKEERRQLDAQILTAKEDAEKSNRSKSEFLANMSHEIRTPMNGVLGMAQLMKDTELSSEQREYIETISASADNLLKIINNILDLSRIEMGKFNLNIDTVNIPLVLNELHTFFTPAVKEKGLELKVGCPDDLPLVRTDEGSLRQVLINLMANAVKFTQKGHVEVEVKCLEKTGNECALEFCISDTGIGISKEAQEIIFHEFTQADGSHTREFGGTGLGLAISKKMVEQLGGRLSVSSESGKGSAFSFT
ncbi:MAG: HAMP domain-containing protein, partial [Pontiella sp.]|nr:HAMP domain-containing protein [Pontiella sp.]